MIDYNAEFANATHRNFLNFARLELVRPQAGFLLEEGGGLFVAGASENHLTSCVSHRVDPKVDATSIVDHANREFGGRGLGFTLVVRHDEPRTGISTRQLRRRV